MQAVDMTQASAAGTHAIELWQLQAHIRTLNTLEEDEALVVSCYVHRAIELKGCPPPFEARLRRMRKVLVGQELERFEERFGRIQHFLATNIRPPTRGIAIFARAGAKPFLLGLQFQMPLPDRLSVSSTPDIQHLVELKDTYERAPTSSSRVVRG